jgi:RNA polymerase sigma-70 factor (ECF subfamily)
VVSLKGITPISPNNLTTEEFKSCFDQLFDPIRNFIYYRSGDADVATDIAQEAFVKVWEKKPDYHPEKIKGLLYKIAKELWISQYRKLESARKYEMSLQFRKDVNHPESNLEYQELKQKYETALSNLPEKQREVFLMSRMEELTYKEIAARLEISVKAVEKRMHQALQDLRKRIP